MTGKYVNLKESIDMLLQEIDDLGYTENAIAKNKLQSLSIFADGRICESPKITTSIKEDTTKLTYSEVLSANEMLGKH